MRLPRPSLVLGIMFLASALTLGQELANPGLEAAEVRASPAQPNPTLRAGVIRDLRYEIKNATMVDLISAAYDVPPDAIAGGPSWLELDRFDIVARVPEGIQPNGVRLMLQQLLTNRFALVLRKGTSLRKTYALHAVGTKPKLKSAQGSDTPGCRPAQGVTQVSQLNVVECRSVTIAMLADFLPRAAGGYVTPPVTDLTGLSGPWDFDLEWTTRALLAEAGSSGITLFEAVERQLGLKLELRDVPLPATIVDRVSRTPTPNPPGIASLVSAGPPPTFEVASLKPSAPGGTESSFRVQPGGILSAQGMTLKRLIARAWSIDDQAISGPEWLDAVRFDLQARASSSSPEKVQIDAETANQMLRALLIERFRLRSRFETRPLSAYVLTATKPRLSKADPQARTKCTEVPPALRDPRSVTPALTLMISCQNVTMRHFAERLRYLTVGYIDAPVVDESRLAGSWTFSLAFSPYWVIERQAVAAGQLAPGGTASDPIGSLTLFEALERQLGLRLVRQQRPGTVLVIDGLERMPVEN